jgi:hypothetical protein
MSQQHRAIKMEERDPAADKWDVEGIFDPPKHAFGSRGNANANLKEGRSPPPLFDKKRKAGNDRDGNDLSFSSSFKSDDGNHSRGHHHMDGAGPAPSAAAAAGPAIEEVYPIKFSLSSEYREDAFFAEYIKEDFLSPRPKNMNSPTMYPSPINVEGSDNLDFDMGGFPMTRLQMSLMSTPPRCSTNGGSPQSDLAYARLESPPSIKKEHSDVVAFGANHRPVDDNNGTSDLIENCSPDRHSVRRGNGNPYHPVSAHIYSGGPTQHLSPGQTIYNVASKSVDSPLSPYQPYPWRIPSSHHSGHSTPLNRNQGGGDANSTPDFLPPRSNLRGQSRSVRETKTSSTVHNHDGHPNEAGLNPATYEITPSPHIHKAVSDETISPLAPTVHHPPQRPVAPAWSGGWVDASHMSTMPPYEHPRQGAWSMQSLPPALPLASPGYHHASSQYYPPYHQHHQAYQRPAVPDPAASDSTAEQRVDDLCDGSEAAEWHKNQYLLHQFLLQFGHCNVPQGYGVGTHYAGLYQWCVNQRSEYQKMCRADSGEVKCEACTMTPTRMQTLTSMGFVWGRPPAAFRPTATANFSGSVATAASKSFSSWNKWIELLTEYKNEHGNVDVPLKYEPNPSLGTFVNRQRTEYRKMQNGKSSSMTQQRIDDLLRLGFTWAIRDSHTSWEDRFNELKEFYNVNGHCNVPKIYSKNSSLGYWVNEQRFQYRRMTKKKSSYMTDEKVQALNELDFKVSTMP